MGFTLEPYYTTSGCLGERMMYSMLWFGVEDVTYASCDDNDDYVFSSRPVKR